MTYFSIVGTARNFDKAASNISRTVTMVSITEICPTLVIPAVSIFF